MNSQKLKQKFPEVYKEFFAKNDLVVSGALSMPWGTLAIGHRSDLIHVRSKLPLRVYVGFRKNNSDELTIGKAHHYDSTSDQYLVDDYSSLNNNYEIFLDTLKKHLNKGYELSFLLEGTRGHGMSLTGGICAVVSAGISILDGSIESELLENEQLFLGSEQFESIFKLARSLDFVSKGKESIGEGVLSSIIMGEFNLYGSENIFENCDVDYFYKKLFENFSNIPLDFALAFSGVKLEAEKTINYKKFHSNSFDNLGKYISSFIEGKNVSNENWFSSSSSHDLKKPFVNILNIQILKFLNLMELLEIQGFNDFYVNDLIETVDSYRKIISTIEGRGEFANNFKNIFDKNRISGVENVGIIPILSGKRGNGYLIVMKEGISKQTFESTISEMKELNPMISVDYSSWEDGKTSDGIKIEQFLSGGELGSLVNSGTIMISNFGNSELGEYRELFDKYKSDSLICDLTIGKLFFNGEKLTSKNCGSQVTATEMFDLLVSSSGKEIINSELSYSSFSQMRNQMQAKIVSPLKKYIFEKTGKELPLKLRGEAGNYYISLGQSEIRVVILKKI